MATAQRKSNALALPDNVISMLAAEDKRKGFPSGTMQSLMMQESSGSDRFIKDPAAYHYGLNSEGKRVAKHTGSISTARGPFGILESTGLDPGYGVKPLGDKNSFADHVRFAADYLDARSKSAGSLNGGLAGYGEGDKYAAQVARRTGTQTPAPVPAQVATQVAEQVPAQVVAPVMADAVPVPAAMPVNATPAPDQMAIAPDAWQEFLARTRASEAAPPVMAQAPAYQPLALNVPDFMGMVAYMNKDRTPNGFQSFNGMDASV